MGTQFTGISRKTEYSPNHVVNDALILQATADALRARGAAVQVLSEDRVGLDSIPDGVVFSMVQGPVAAGRLSAIERDRGLLVVNSPRAVMNCYRTEMIRLLPEHGVPFPRSVLLNLGGEEGPSPAVEGQRLWLKRGDVHAVHREDVVLTHHGEERRFLLCEFRNRGIGQAVLQEHLEGDTVKFYALRDSDFFHWYYPNGAEHHAFDEQLLRQWAVQSAEALGLYVFGGDAIISAAGDITIIDVNDWPSFAPVRDRAAVAIAELLLRQAAAGGQA